MVQLIVLSIIILFPSQFANLLIDFRECLVTHWQSLSHLEVVGPVKHLDELIPGHQSFSVQALGRNKNGFKYYNKDFCF